MRTLAVSVALTALLASGCGLLPHPPEDAPTLTTTFDPRGATFTLDPWHDLDSVAFLCLHRPGAEFTTSHPLPAVGAQCQPIASTMGGSTFTARFDVDVLQPGLRDAFLSSGPPWFLAVTGHPGVSDVLVQPIQDSPIPSDPGPS